MARDKEKIKKQLKKLGFEDGRLEKLEKAKQKDIPAVLLELVGLSWDKLSLYGIKEK